MSNRYRQPPYGGQAQAAPPYGPGYASGAGQATGRRFDAMDLLEGVLNDGLSLTSLTRIARASGSRFWLGAAIGVGVVMLMHRPDVRATLASVKAARQRARAESQGT